MVVAETHACPYACRDTRQRLSTDCEHPQLRRVLAHPPTACVTRLTTGEVVELFDEWVYKLFLTDLDADGLLAEDILDL